MTIRLVLLRLYALLLLLIGLSLLVGGGHLLRLGGSPYYLLAGAMLSSSAVLLWLRSSKGALLYGLLVLLTVAWALWESGYDGWALMPRLAMLVVLGFVLMAPSMRPLLFVPRAPLSGWAGLACLILSIVVGTLLHRFLPSSIHIDPLYRTGTTTAPAAVIQQSVADGKDWHNYGNDSGGSRFSSLTQIDPGNVGSLKLAWSYAIGPHGGHMEATPLKVDDSLFVCTGFNDVIALNAESGTQVWRFEANVDVSKTPSQNCRGVAYYRLPNAVGPCAERIITNTIDARLIALDAHTGTRCSDFGTNGEVSLLTGMGNVTPGYYYVTSAPTMVRGKIVLGGWVADGQRWGEPSGVIRAFDAVTGKLAWAWDLGRPEQSGEPKPGETYTPATPNAWAPMSADEMLGMVYVPLGNSTPDYFGSQRRSFDEQFTDAVVALDAETGKLRWSFQTTHHDLWDYDNPAQPTLVDYPAADGSRVRALLQPTKRGELFVLDRITGAPLMPVEEQPVPQSGAVPEEQRISRTQPFSTAMPAFRGRDLVEEDSWGITPLDQLWCRIKFREARYDGHFTLPGLQASIQAPGYFGGMEWGGVAVDLDRHMVIVNSNSIPNYPRLVRRAEADAMGIKPFTGGDASRAPIGTMYAQQGTPYGMLTGPFLSPLQVPCTQPPYGRLSAVDLTSGRLIWTQVFGTAQELGPLGVRSRLPFTIGTPNRGGAVITRSRIFFIGATQDKTLRAYDTISGKMLWKSLIPGLGEATPMTYMSGPNGRQFVVIATTGNDGPDAAGGDEIVAYSLPDDRSK